MYAAKFTSTISLKNEDQALRGRLGNLMENAKMQKHQYDMSIFNGTEFEGMTYMQVRLRLSESQVAKLDMLRKRDRAKARYSRDCARFVGTEYNML